MHESCVCMYLYVVYLYVFKKKSNNNRAKKQRHSKQSITYKQNKKQKRNFKKHLKDLKQQSHLYGPNKQQQMPLPDFTQRQWTELKKKQEINI